MDNKRMFLGMEVVAPWPDELPLGRILLESDRHLTLAFIGEEAFFRMQTLLMAFPKPPFTIGFAGYFDHLLFLPCHSPRVVAWHIQWLEGKEVIFSFQKGLIAWLQENGLDLKEQNEDFLAHVTIARDPLTLPVWKESFEKRPLFIRNLHLYESLGHSRYQILWTYPILAPFEELEHTADIAFLIRGTTIQELFLHAQLALSFQMPRLLKYFSFEEVKDVESIVRLLNAMVGKADQEQGVPLKAISYHGSIKRQDILEWEMIVDV